MSNKPNASGLIFYTLDTLNAPSLINTIDCVPLIRLVNSCMTFAFVEYGVIALAALSKLQLILLTYFLFLY